MQICILGLELGLGLGLELGFVTARESIRIKVSSGVVINRHSTCIVGIVQA